MPDDAGRGPRSIPSEQTLAGDAVEGNRYRRRRGRCSHRVAHRPLPERRTCHPEYAQRRRRVRVRRAVGHALLRPTRPARRGVYPGGDRYPGGRRGRYRQKAGESVAFDGPATRRRPGHRAVSPQ